MGVVGIAFGSATSGDGFDVSKTVDQIVENLQNVEKPWKQQLTKLQQQDSALSTLGTGLSTMLTSLQNLTDFTAVMASKKGSSSNSNLLELTSASSSAVAGSHTVVIENLAQTASYATGYVSSSNALSGSLSLTVNGNTTSFDMSTLDDQSLSGLVTAINRAGLGVTASILNGTLGSKLSIVSNTSGDAGNFSLSSSISDTVAGTAFSFSQTQPGKDAAFKIDGVELTSATNSVANAIQGITFQLLGNSSEEIQIQVTNDVGSVESAVTKFVSNYNSVMESINGQEGKDSAGTAEPLYGTSVLAQLQQRLQASVIFSGASGSIRTLSDLGISMNNDGTLSVNTDKLSSALSSNYSSVASFFQDGGNFGRTLADTLNNLGNVYSSGLITLTRDEIASEESVVNDKIEQQEALISRQKEVLTTQLARANQILQDIPTQLDYINKIYSASTGYNQK